MSQPTENAARHITYCRLCEAQCGLVATVQDGTITQIDPDREHPVSRGHLCVKARGMLNVTYDPDRVLQPLRRRGAPGEFEPVSWDNALDDIAARLSKLVSEHSGSALATYIGNPAAFATAHYAYGYTFTGLFGSDRFYNAMQVDTGARVLASELVFGSSQLYPFPDLPDTDLLLIFGGNPMISHMSLICAPRARELLDQIHARDGVIVVDPRYSETAQRFEHQAIQPDSDVWLLLGLLKHLIEAQLTDEQLLATRVSGWAALKQRVCTFDWTQISARSGIESTAIKTLASRFAAAPRASCYGRVGTNRGRFSTMCNVLMDALNLASGNFAKAGGCVIGRSPFQAKGERHQPNYGLKRSRVGDLPLIGATQPGGALAEEILTPGEGQIRALFLDGGNPVLAYPNGEQTAQALECLELFVSLDFYQNESNRYADYILPVPTFYERADINDLWSANAPQPWLQMVDPVIPPRGESRHEYAIYDAILQRLDMPDMVSVLTGAAPSDTQQDGTRGSYLEIADRLLRAGDFGDQLDGGGLSLAKLRAEHPHGLVLSERVDACASWQQIGHSDGKALLWNEVIEQELTRLTKERTERAAGELKLFGRRLLHGMNSWMHNSERVIRNAKPTLLMHPLDARDRQIEDGARVQVKSASGAINVVVELSNQVIAGSVSYPHGFGHQGGWQQANGIDGANVNQLASSDPQDWEGVSGNCHLDGIKVQVTPRP